MQIERVFDRNQVDAQVAGGIVEPGAVRFDLYTPFAQGLERLRGLKNELMAALGVPDVQMDERNGRFQVQVARPDAPPVPLLDLMPLIAELPPLTAVLGMAEDDRPLLLNLAEEGMTHILIAGDAGAGKTSLLRTMAVSLALRNRQSQLQLLVVQPTSDDSEPYTDLAPLDYLPHMLTTLVSDPKEATDILQYMRREMQYRQEQNVTHPAVVIVIDRFVTLLETGETGLTPALTDLLQHGADVGIHLILGTRRPAHELLARPLHALLPVRIVGQLADRREARAASDMDESRAEYLLGQGDFLAIGSGSLLRFQAAFIGDYDLHVALTELHRRRPPALLARDMDPRKQMVPGQESDGAPEGPYPFSFNGWSVRWQDSRRNGDNLEIQQ
ncbi:MAG: hypothetical protein KC443_21585 [Anaerolineales bacterium]|nr:hypothetical protein [Anaerolineales bacterium]